MSPALLILAAGIGSRYGSLKQIDRVGPSGETILDYSIYDAIHAGFQRIVFVIRKDIETDMREVFFEKWQDKVELDYAYQEIDMMPEGFTPPKERIKPWGTGHAIWVARHKIQTPFLAINADDYYGGTSYELAGNFLSDINNLINSRYCLIGYILRNTLSEHGFVSRAECRMDDQNRLSHIKERTHIKRVDEQVVFEDDYGNMVQIDERTIVSMNMWGFMPSVFDFLESGLREFFKKNAGSLNAEFLLPAVIDNLIRAGEVEVPVLPSSEKWFGMTYQEDREMVKSKLAALTKKGIYPSPLWK